MPAAEIKVTINGPVAVTFNDYSGGTPAYVLRNTPKLLEPPQPRQTKTDRQGEHGVSSSLSFYNERLLTFDGEILGSSQADRKTKEETLKQCLSLRALQSYAGPDGFVLVQITDEDSALKQCYAKIISPVTFDVLDNTEPARRGFGFVMMAQDAWLYSQSLQTQSGTETYQGTNFSVIQGTSPTVPFSLYQNTVASATCTNSGTADAPPVITVTGPTTSPKVTNVTTGKYLVLTGLTLAAAEMVTIDVGKRSILKNDNTNLSGYWGTGSSWWVLQPGANALTLLDGTPSLLQATCQIQWRNTYI